MELFCFTQLFFNVINFFYFLHIITVESSDPIRVVYKMCAPPKFASLEPLLMSAKKYTSGPTLIADVDS